MTPTLAPLTFTFPDDRAYLALAHRGMKRHARRRWRWPARVLAFAGVAVLLVTLQGWPRTASDAVGLAVALLFVGVTWWALFRRHVRLRQQEALERADPNFGGSITMTVADEGVHFAGEAMGNALRWPAVRRVVEDADLFLFFYCDHCAFALPAAAVDAGAGRDALRREVLARLGARAHLLEAA